jgi:hypothetical protein
MWEKLTHNFGFLKPTAAASEVCLPVSKGKPGTLAISISFSV